VELTEAEMIVEGTPGIKLGEHSERILKGLKAHKGYCLSDIQKTEGSKCPCYIFRKTGMCSCGLFVKSN